MNHKKQDKFKLRQDDALIIVDVQKDFLPGGSLAVPEGDQVIPTLNRYIEKARSKNLHVYATRDWHPINHSSFLEQGGPWPPHCVAGTEGAEFAEGLNLSQDLEVISKAIEVDKDAYSGFQDTDLDKKLRTIKVDRLFIGGLATDYCVLNTVKDAIKLGYTVLLLEDAIRAVNVNSEDGEKAKKEMIELGAMPINLKRIT